MPGNQNWNYSVYESSKNQILLVYDTFNSLKLAEWKQFTMTYRIIGGNLRVSLIPKMCLLLPHVYIRK